MKKQTTIIRTAMVATMLVISCFPILAQDTVDKATCSASISEVERVFWDMADYIGGKYPDRTRTSLYSKLTGAKTKLSQDKYYDAQLKLEQFGEKIMDLTEAKGKKDPKLAYEHAAKVMPSTNEAICCVKQLRDSTYQCAVP